MLAGDRIDFSAMDRRNDDDEDGHRAVYGNFDIRSIFLAFSQLYHRTFLSYRRSPC